MSSDIAIRVDGIGKRYSLGESHAYRALRDELTTAFGALGRHVFRRSATRQADSRWIWALRDVSFEVKAGQVLGIIGRNGAGKSTLLKILSRITDPTEGMALVRGRVGSLLEVGTGFHPELTGRENVFLNGALLGMSRAEMKRRFDEIVAFAEIDRFIDTPVKRYSSGMYVRLAFAVAAHIEPEVLLVDEVLAVGDVPFQRKCIGRLHGVARSGRTVLFISHNMGAVQSLCDRAILLDGGRIIADGPPGETIDRYLALGAVRRGERTWSSVAAPSFPDDSVRLCAIRAVSRSGAVRDQFDVKDEVIVESEYQVLQSRHVLVSSLWVSDGSGNLVFVTMDNLDSPWNDTPAPVGRYRARCHIPGDLLNEGTLRVEFLVCANPLGRDRFAYYKDAISFDVIDDRATGGVRGNWSGEWFPAVIRPRLRWTTERVE